MDLNSIANNNYIRLDAKNVANDNFSIMELESGLGVFSCNVELPYTSTDVILDKIKKEIGKDPLHFLDGSFVFLRNKLDKKIRHVFMVGQSRYIIVFWDKNHNDWFTDEINSDCNLSTNYRFYFKK
jgi:hypothetical protein